MDCVRVNKQPLQIDMLSFGGAWPRMIKGLSEKAGEVKFDGKWYQ